MPEPSAFEFDMAIEKLKRHRSPDIDQIPLELIKTCGRKLVKIFENNLKESKFYSRRN